MLNFTINTLFIKVFGKNPGVFSHLKCFFFADIDVEDHSKFTIANEETRILGRHRIVIATSQGRELLIASSATLGMASIPM
jgi:hypothetical protein